MCERSHTIYFFTALCERSHKAVYHIFRRVAMNSTKKLKRTKQWLAIGLVLFLSGAIFASLIQSCFGLVSVKHVTFKDNAGYTISGYLYVPQNATADTPAPAIVISHGNNSYISCLASLNIELSRRGYVVLALELEGHGDSDYVPDAEGDGSYGGIAAATYLNTLDFVDHTQLGATGHSKGGNAAIGIAKTYPDQVKGILLNGFVSPAVTGGSLDDVAPHTNIGIAMSRYDEGAQDLLHHIYGTEWNYDYLKGDAAETIFNDRWGGRNISDYLNVGIGSFEEGTMRIFYTMEDCTHVTTVDSKTTVRNALDFFNQSMEAPYWIDATNQIWPMRYFGGIVQTIGFVITFLSLATLLLNAAPFRILTAAQSAPTEKLQGTRGPLYKLFFIIIFTLIPVITFTPMYVFGENEMKQTALFPFNPSSFGYLFWTIANTVLMLIVFLIWHFVYGKKHGGNLRVYGLTFADRKNAAGYIGKAVLYAVVLVVIMFAGLSITENLLNVEMSTPISCIRTFRLDRLVYFVEYFIPFFVSFLIGNLAFSAILRDDSGVEQEATGKNMVRNQLIGVLQGVGGLTIMYAIWNLVYFVRMKPTFLYRETPYFMGNCAYTCICYSLIPMFGINSILSTHFSVKTRRIIVGAFVCALFIVWITFAGQSLALPSTQSAVGPLAK